MVKQLQLWTQGQCALLMGLDEIQYKGSQLLLMACIAMVGLCDYVQLMVWDVCCEHQGVFHRDDFIFGAVNREDPADRYKISFRAVSLKDLFIHE